MAQSQAERMQALEASMAEMAAGMATLTATLTALVAAPAAKSGARALRSVDGRDFPCTAEPACGRMLRSAKRAAIHGVDAGGHTAR